MKNIFFLTVVMALLGACGAGPSYKATLSPGSEVPAATSSGSGSVTGTLSGTTLTISGTYSALTGAATAAHIHTGASGVAGPVACPLTVTEGSTAGSGSISGTCASISTTDLDSGNLYVNVHTMANAGGEIRGQLGK